MRSEVVVTRRIIVMRHAHSPSTSVPGGDHARPLDARGQHEAAEVGAALTRRGWLPERVVASDARRVQDTWNALALEGRIAVEFTRALYDRGAEAALEALSLVAPQTRTVLLLGHNPEWERLIGWLSGDTPRLSTANAALLRGEPSDWEAAVGGPGRFALLDVIRPIEAITR